MSEQLNLPALEWHNERRKVNDLLPWDHNPRILTEKQADDLKRSVAKFNLVEIPVINTNNMIVAGHQRLKIMALLGRGEEEIDVRVPNRALTDEEYREYCVRSNLNRGEFDFDMLANEWDQELLLDWGFTKKDLGMDSSQMFPDEGEDEVPDTAKITPLAVEGDVYEIKTANNVIRIGCGDCRNLDFVNKVMAGNKAHLSICDPPYNVDYGSSSIEGGWRKEQRQIMNDSMSDADFKQFLRDIFTSVAATLHDGGMSYVFMSDQEWGTLMEVKKECGYHWSSTIVWNKDSLVLSRSDYHSKHELLWYGWLANAARIHPLEDRDQSDVWDCDRPKKSDLHPTQKPVELYERALRNSSNQGDNVIDFFLGSGTALIAGIKTKRNVFGTELDPRFVDTELKRVRDYCKEIGVEMISVSRNGEPFTIPEVYEPTEEAKAAVQENSKN